MSLGSDVSNDIFHLFRRFRHDLLNDLQILGGHLQMNKSREVLTEDVHAMTGRIQQISRLFACGDDQLALTLWSLQDTAADYEVKLSIETSRLTEAVAPKWHQALLRLGAALIAHAYTLCEEQQRLSINLGLPRTATFVMQSADVPSGLEVPGFSVQVAKQESSLIITVTSTTGEE